MGQMRLRGREAARALETLVPVDVVDLPVGSRRDALFTVVLEHFLTDTPDHADHVPPAPTQPAHSDLPPRYGHPWLLLTEPAIAPLAAAPPNTHIFPDPAALPRSASPGAAPAAT